MPAMTKDQDRDRGSVTPIVALALVPMMMIAALIVDSGRVWLDRQRVQTGAEAALSAASVAWVTTGSACEPAALELAMANVDNDAVVSCAVTGNRYDGRIDVTVSHDVDTRFARLLGRTETGVSSDVGAVVGGATSIDGVRPLALCIHQPDIAAWLSSGYTAAGLVTIGLGSGSNCAGGVPGNWGIIDLNGGANSNAETQAWIDAGFPHPVTVPGTYEGEPGIPSPSIGIEAIIGETVVIPLYDAAVGSGAIAQFELVSFAAITIHSAELTGPAAGRHLVVSFEKMVLDGPCCTSGARNAGVTAWRFCALDDQGDCP